MDYFHSSVNTFHSGYGKNSKHPDEMLLNSLTPWKFLMLFCHLLTFFKTNLFEKLFQIPSECQDQARHLDLGPTCLQRLSADDTSR